MAYSLKYYQYITLSLVGLVLLSGAFLMSSYSYATDDSTVDNVSITVPVSCSLSGTGMNSHNASVVNGTYQADIGTTTMKAFCNDTNGFAIYVIGYTDNEYGKTVLTNSTLGSSADIATGTATSGSTSNWAMKLATSSSATYPLTLDNSFDNYHNVPTEYTKVAHRDSGTDIGTSAVGSELTSTYAAYMSQTQPAGTYTGQVKYTLVHPSDRAAPVACNPNAITIAEAKCLQDFAHVTEANRNSIIASMTPEQQYTLKDSRDGKSYTIAKYQVGEPGNYDVWMTQNLDLDLIAGETYTNEDTDIGYNTTTGTYNTAAWSPARSTYSNNAIGEREWCAGGIWDSEYNHCEDNSTPVSYDPGNLFWNTTVSGNMDWSAYWDSCTTVYSTNCDETLNPISTYTSSTGIAQYHLGNYYNWTVAVAMNDSSSHTEYEELIEQSICPAGWTLPRTGIGEDSFYALWSKYGYDENFGGFSNASTLWSSPLYFTVGGAFIGRTNAIGANSFYWTPIVVNADAAMEANFFVEGYASPSHSFHRYQGFSLRCVARPVSTTITW